MSEYRYKNKYFNKQQGFTLIEVLLVVGITGIITVFSGLNLIGFQRRTTLRTSADELISNLRKVQSLSVAAKDNLSYGVHIEQDYYEIFSGSSYVPGDSENIKVALSPNVEILNVGLSPDNSVVFEKLSGYPDYTGSLDISLGTEVITVTINSEGVINVLESGTIEIPGNFNLLSPPNGFIETTTLMPSFDWEDSSGTGITYQLWHSTSQSFSTKTTVDSGSTSSATLSANKKLADNSRNYWKVKATNDQGFSTWSAQTWYVDTQVASPPTSFNLITPTNGESLVTVTPLLDWGDSTDPDGGSITYTLWVDDNSDFSSLLFEKTGLTTSEYSVQAGDGLLPSSTYYWVVKSTDDELSETWSTQLDWNFSISGGSVPTNFDLVSPTNGNKLSSSLPSFNWDDSIDPDGGSVTYTLWIDDNSDFSSLVLEKTGLTASNYTLVSGEELISGTYYWKIKAVDDEATITWSNQEDWNFIIELNVAPGAFNLLAPVSGTTFTSTEGLIFDWGDSVDPNLADTVTYTILIDNNSDYSSPEVSVSGLTNSTYTVSTGLQNNQTYYWKIIATDGLLTTTSTQTNWSFSISADIYVDQSIPVSGDGTSWAKAFKTLSEGVAVLVGGKTVNIASGVYDETITLTTAHSGTAIKTTKFIAKIGDTVIVNGAGTNEALFVDGTEYVYFEKISFSDTSDYGAELRNGAYRLTFESCTFSNNSNDGVYSPESANAYIIILNSTASNNGDNGLEITGSNFIIDNTNLSNNVDYGAYLNSLTTSEIKNSQINLNGEYGLYLNLGNTISLYNNTINNSGTSVARDGIYSYRTASMKIHHNTVSNSLRVGISLAQMDYGLGSLPVSEIHHNIVYLSATDGIYANTSYGGMIYNNTIDSSNTAGLYLRTFNGLLTVRNNNITNNSTGFRVQSGNSNLSHNYANFWGNGSNFQNQGSTYAGTNSIYVNPLYVNQPARNYNLQAGSGCINAGDPSFFYNDPDGTRSDINALHYPQ